MPYLLIILDLIVLCSPTQLVCWEHKRSGRTRVIFLELTQKIESPIMGCISRLLLLKCLRIFVYFLFIRGGKSLERYRLSHGVWRAYTLQYSN